MHDDDFLKWRNLDWLGPRKRPNLPATPSAPSTRVFPDRYPRSASFEERLTFEDKLFLESVGIAI